MAIATTYEPIMTSTISGGPTSITLNSIPSTYTDLRLVINYSFNSPYGNYNAELYVNGRDATHSTTEFGGNGSTASSARQSNVSGWLITFRIGSPTTEGSGILIADFLDYANPNKYKTALIRHNVPASSAPGLQQGIGVYHSNSAISSITLIGNTGSTLAEGTLTLYGIKSADNASANKATGGTITAASGYTYHAFTSGGTFTPSQDITADILLVAGGGGGGTYSGGGGGGGAGGVLLLANQSLTSGTGYTVSVGGGGTANTNGQNSYFGALTQAVGGGKGGSASAGGNGGSGGGGSDSTYAGGTGTAGQGFNGGVGSGGGAAPGGGGGGALDAGQNAFADSTPNIAGAGGSGTNIYYDWAAATSTGVSGYFAGGGGGGIYINSAFANNGGGAGGNGGGGSGTASSKNATTNSGSGGGGGSYTTSPVAPGNGGSGIVIVRYAN